MKLVQDIHGHTQKQGGHLMPLRICLFVILVLALSACGFQLRGSSLDKLKNSHVYIQSTGAGDLAAEVRKQLEFSDVSIVNDPGQADYIIELFNESFKRSVLSVSVQTGKVEEYQVIYNASLSVRGPDGKTLLKNEPVTAQRDFTFDDQDSVLGKFDEENTLHEEIMRYAADTVLRRLQAVSR